MNSEKRILKSKGTFVDNVEFEYFISFTFSIKDSNEYTDIEEKVKKTLRKINEEYNSFEFIFVPEEHKNGIHYHGLIKDLKKETATNLLSELGFISIQKCKKLTK